MSSSIKNNSLIWDNIWQSTKKITIIDDSDNYDILLYIAFFQNYANENKLINIAVSDYKKYSLLSYLLNDNFYINVHFVNKANKSDLDPYVLLSDLKDLDINHCYLTNETKQQYGVNRHYIITALSFYNENDDNYHQSYIKRNYDIISKISQDSYLCSMDGYIPTLFSRFIKEKTNFNIYDNPYKALMRLETSDIVITYDNLTAQLALLLGKFVIIIADKRFGLYQHIKDKKCCILRPDDTDLINKAIEYYKNTIQEIYQNNLNYNRSYYLEHRCSCYDALYQKSIIAFKDKKLHAALLLLQDIPQRHRKISMLRHMMIIYYNMKNYLQYIKIANLLKKECLLNIEEIIYYIECLVKVKKVNKAKQEVRYLYENKIFLQSNVSLVCIKQFIHFLYYLGYYKELQIYCEHVAQHPSYKNNKFFIIYFIYLGYLNHDFKQIHHYLKELLQHNIYKSITPVWQGQHQKHLIIWCQDMLGDAVVYLSLLHYIVPYMKSVTLCCEERLHNLLKRSLPTLDIISCDKNNVHSLLLTKKYDYQISSIAIPAIINFSASNNKAQRFLYPNHKLQHYYREHLQKIAKKRIIIGISNGTKNKQKYIDWKYWEPIFKIENAIFVNLEYDQSEKDSLKEIAINNHYSLVTWQEPHPILEFDDFTALVSACDIIVTGATTLAHQAGGLGILSFVLLTHTPPYYYGSTGNKSYWYENQHYIRPTTKNNNYKTMMIKASKKIQNLFGNDNLTQI